MRGPRSLENLCRGGPVSDVFYEQAASKKGPGVWKPRAFNSKEFRDAIAYKVSRSPRRVGRIMAQRERRGQP